MLRRPPFEITVPSLPGQAEAQSQLRINPHEVARHGLRMANDPKVIKKPGGRDGPIGYVAPLHRRRRPPIYMRSLYPNALGLPTGRAELEERMLWHTKELGRLARAGARIPIHYSVLCRSPDTWGEGWGLFTAVEWVTDPSNSRLIWARSPEGQGPLREVGDIMRRYLTDPDRPPEEYVIADLGKPSQFGGNCVFDLDPYRNTRLDELQQLQEYVRLCQTCPESVALEQQIAADRSAAEKAS
jgi:hypothetical protein